MATTIAELLVKIKTNQDQTKSELKDLRENVEDTNKNIGKSVKGITTAFKSIGVTMAALGVTKIAKDFIVLAGDVDSVGTSFRNLAKNAQGGSQGLLEALRKSTKGTVDNLELMRSANLALQLMGEGVAEHLPKMAEIAAAAARTQGTSVQQMMNDIVVATGRQSVMILDNLGISSARASQEIEKYAASLGKTREQLTEAEKRAAFFNAVMVAGQDIIEKSGAEGITFSEALQQLRTTFNNIAIDLAEKVAPHLSEFVQNLNAIVNKINALRKDYTAFQLAVAKIGLKLTITQKERINTLNNIRNLEQELNELSGDNIDLTRDRTKEEEKLMTVFKKRQERIKERKKQYTELENLEKDYTMKTLQEQGNRRALIDAAELEAFEQVKELTLVSETEKEELRTQIAQYYANQRKQYEIQKTKEIIQNTLQLMSQLTAQLSGILNQYVTNRNITLDNDRVREQTRLDESYQAQKEQIENNIKDETERNAALKTLDEKKARDDEKLNKEIDKKKRKIARDAAKKQKKLAIAETLIAIPQAAFAAFKAMAGIPYVGPILGAIAAAAATALGFAKLALIKQQPLPAAQYGGVFDQPYIGGEAGREIAVPLESDQGQNAIQQFATGMLDAMSQQIDTRASIEKPVTTGQTGGGNVYLDGTLVGKWISKASDNGLFRLNARVVV